MLIKGTQLSEGFGLMRLLYLSSSQRVLFSGIQHSAPNFPSGLACNELSVTYFAHSIIGRLAAQVKRVLIVPRRIRLLIKRRSHHYDWIQFYT